MDNECKRLRDYEIDWNRWYKKLDDSMEAFPFDDAAVLCKDLGLVEHEDDDTIYEVEGASLYRDVQYLAKILIAMKENNWEPIDKSGILQIFNNSYAYIDDGMYIAELKFYQDRTKRLQTPFIRIALNSHDDFIIEFIVIGQIF